MYYGYARVSTDMQESSREAQVGVLTSYAESKGEKMEVFVDEDVSGRIPLKDRPAGKRLWDQLKPGDVVVVTNSGRAFRNLVDAATTHMIWKQYGVRLHIIDLPIDLSTDEGEMIFLQGAVFSQYERKIIGRRIKAGLQFRKKNGLPYGGTRPLGWVRDGNRWKECEPERELGRKIVRMRESGVSWGNIVFALMHNKKPVVKKGCRPWYGRSDVIRLWRAAVDGFPVRAQSDVPDPVQSQTPPC